MSSTNAARKAFTKETKWFPGISRDSAGKQNHFKQKQLGRNGRSTQTHRVWKVTPRAEGAHGEGRALERTGEARPGCRALAGWLSWLTVAPTLSKSQNPPK